MAPTLPSTSAARQPGRIETNNQPGVRVKYFISPSTANTEIEAPLPRDSDRRVGNRNANRNRDVLEIDEHGARRQDASTSPRLHRLRLAHRRSRRHHVKTAAISARRLRDADHSPSTNIPAAWESSPEIVTRGFNPGENGLIERAREIVMETLNAFQRRRKSDYGVIKRKFRTDNATSRARRSEGRPDYAVILEI